MLTRNRVYGPNKRVSIYADGVNYTQTEPRVFLVLCTFPEKYGVEGRHSEGHVLEYLYLAICIVTLAGQTV